MSTTNTVAAKRTGRQVVGLDVGEPRRTIYVIPQGVPVPLAPAPERETEAPERPVHVDEPSEVPA